MAGFDVSTLLGPQGGQLALAFGTGCAAGYAFCLRTVYKLLASHKDAENKTCMERINLLASENNDLRERMTVLEDRWYMGSQRQTEQIRQSSVQVLGKEKLGEDYKG